MQNCKSCERELQKDEVEFCPACASSKSHKIKKIIEAATLIVRTYAKRILTDGFLSC